MPKYNTSRDLLWQLIAKNRKRRLELHTALRTVDCYCSKWHDVIDVRNDFLLLRTHERQWEKIARLADGGICIFVTFAQSITFKTIIYSHDSWSSTRLEPRFLKRGTTVK